MMIGYITTFPCLKYSTGIAKGRKALFSVAMNNCADFISAVAALMASIQMRAIKKTVSLRISFCFELTLTLIINKPRN